MCGRFSFDIPPDLLLELLGLREAALDAPSYNIAPTQKVAVIRLDQAGEKRLDYLQWGLIPSWAKESSIGSKMINARSETVAEKPAFRQALRQRRCIVPASGFYEWKQEGKRKHPLYISLGDSTLMAFAGLWDAWRAPDGGIIESCTILTTAANEMIEPFHQRMPVILHPDQHDAWLDPKLAEPAKLADLFRPYPAQQMQMWPVSPLVNSVKNNSRELLQPLKPVPVQETLGLY